MKGIKAVKKRIFAILVAMLFVLCSVDYGAVSAAAADPGSSAYHEHDGKEFTAWSSAAYNDLGNGNITLLAGNYYLTEDVNLPYELIVSGITASICLNGHTLNLNGKSIYLEFGATLNIYDCDLNGQEGVITNGAGHYASGTKGGAFYVKSSELNLYGGSIENSTAEWGGAIFIDASEASSTVNMYNGTIKNNTAEYGGGGIEVENDNSVFNMYGGSIINNNVKSLSGNVHKGGGVHFASGKMTIDGTVNISGNTAVNEENNLYMRKGKIVDINSIGAGSRIGVSSIDIEQNATSDISIAKYKYPAGNDDFKCFFMDGLHDKAKYALVNNGGYLQIIPHKHSWKYRADSSENVLYAYCDTTTSKCGYYGDTCTALPLTIEAKSPVVYDDNVYNGAKLRTQELDVFNAETGSSLSNSDIVYYTTADLSKMTSAADGAAADGKAPSNIGTYYAAIKVNDVTAKVKFIIKGAPVKVTKPTGLTMEFNNTEQELVKAGSVEDESTSASAGIMQYQVAADDSKLTESGWSNDVPKATAAGTYRVYYRVITAKNYEPVDYTQGYPYEVAEITKKDVPAPEIDGIKNNAKYCGSVIIDVKGKNLKQITVDGAKVTPNADGKYTITADNKTHTISAEDMYGNVTKYTITVYTGHDFDNLDYSETGRKGDIITEEAACGHGCDRKVIRKRTPQGDIISQEYPNDNGVNGSLTTEIKVNDGTPVTSVSGLDIEVAKAFLDPVTELPRVQNGESLLVYLKVNRLEESAIPADDKEKTEKRAAVIENLKQGMYLDLSMWKKIGTADEVKLTNAETTKELKITINLPAALKAPSGKVRTYYVIRVHNGVATVLPTELNGDTISFKTDMFSTYSIWYTEKDTSAPSVDKDDNTGAENSSTDVNTPKTADENNVGLLGVMLLLSAVGMIGITQKKKKEIHN